VERVPQNRATKGIFFLTMDCEAKAPQLNFIYISPNQVHHIYKRKPLSLPAYQYKELVQTSYLRHKAIAMLSFNPMTEKSNVIDKITFQLCKSGTLMLKYFPIALLPNMPTG
jgi:hypothetical protein